MRLLLIGTLVIGCPLFTGCMSGPPLLPVAYAEQPAEQPVPPTRWSPPSEPYLVRLREQHDLDTVIAGAETDTERMLRVARWARTQWEHNGSNTPSKFDPITILNEAAGGERFRCVEYAIVVAGALNAVEVPARVVGLKTADVETRKVGAGHVVAEVYLADHGKWAMVDGQWNAVVTRGGVPLSAAEVRLALDESPEELEIVGLGDARRPRGGYLNWLAPYLYYLDVGLDNRYGVESEPGRLMLVPEGAPEPRIFQRKSTIRNLTYTRSLDAFYAPPSKP